MVDSKGQPYVFQSSQGHLEKVNYQDLQKKFDYDLDENAKQFSELKSKEKMPKFLKKNITINENSPEYKQMEEKLVPSLYASAEKNIRIAQESSKAIQEKKKKVEELKRLIPNWNIDTVLKSLNNIVIPYNDQIDRLSPEQVEELSKSMAEEFAKYQKDIKNLHDYLVKNNYVQTNK
jgi:hypothetical protein